MRRRTNKNIRRFDIGQKSKVSTVLGIDLLDWYLTEMVPGKVIA